MQKTASRKRKHIKIEPKMYVWFLPELDYYRKISKNKTLLIK